MDDRVEEAKTISTSDTVVIHHGSEGVALYTLGVRTKLGPHHMRLQDDGER